VVAPTQHTFTVACYVVFVAIIVGCGQSALKVVALPITAATAPPAQRDPAAHDRSGARNRRHRRHLSLAPGGAEIQHEPGATCFVPNETRAFIIVSVRNLRY
jgi:hypothetical protein